MCDVSSSLVRAAILHLTHKSAPCISFVTFGHCKQRKVFLQKNDCTVNLFYLQNVDNT